MSASGVAVVGTGFIGPVHVEALRRLGRTVVGVCGSRPERGRAAAERLGLRKSYDDFEQLLADPSVGIVHIASPNVLHFDQTTRAIQAGKHVICEKPLANNSTQTDQLVQLARDSGMITAVCYNVRFYPMCLYARELIRSGQLGRVLHVTGSYLQDWLLYETDFNWRVLSAQAGPLRAVADIGTHWIDLVSFITGSHVRSVCADLGAAHATRLAPDGPVETFADSGNVRRRSVPIDTEDFGSLMMRFDNGAAGTMTVSQVMAGRKNCIRFDIACEQGSLSWDSEEPNRLMVGRRDRPSEQVARDPALLTGATSGFSDYPAGHAEGFPDSFKQLFRAVYAAIDASEAGSVSLEEPLYATFEDGHREVKICEAVLRSHRERHWESI